MAMGFAIAVMRVACVRSRLSGLLDCCRMCMPIRIIMSMTRIGSRLDGLFDCRRMCVLISIIMSMDCIGSRLGVRTSMALPSGMFVIMPFSRTSWQGGNAKAMMKD